MPRMNGLGPQNAGPMTGRGMGYCAGASKHTFSHNRGMGMRLGRGYGCRGYYEPVEMTPEQQKEILNQQKSFLERELASIDEQIEKL